MGQFTGWRNFDPTKKNNAKGPVDRGTGRGAKRCIVDRMFNILDYDTAKSAGIIGDHFQSRSEAKRYVGLSVMLKAGGIQPDPRFGGKWRQVAFPLHTRNQDGLIVVVAKLILDFVYQVKLEDTAPPAQRWVTIYEDVKPAGGHREDTYLLKKRWFEAEYGNSITEFF